MSLTKRVASVLLALAFAAIVAPSEALAQEIVTVATVDDFSALAERVSTGDTMKDVTVQQVADLDFSGVKWVVPIGTKTYPFEGTYDGQGYTIANADVYKLVSGAEVAYLGLFGKAQGATFRNMVVRDLNVWIHTSNAAYEAMLCAVMDSCTVENCDIQGAVGAESGTSSLVMGGMCTEASDCTISNTSVDYRRSEKDIYQFFPQYTSAVFARVATRCVFQNCYASGTINNADAGSETFVYAGDNNVGSLVATLVDSSVDSCCADVSIKSYVSSGYYSGGLVGCAEGSSISNCVCRGSFDYLGYNESGSVGGLVGLLGKRSSLTRCSNEADMTMTVTLYKFDVAEVNKTGDTCAGGLAGVVAGDSTIDQCVNSGDVSVKVTGRRHAFSRAGGVIGKGSISAISNCYNIGDVHVEAETTEQDFQDSNCVVGGIAASLDEEAEVTNCYNAGILSSQYLTMSKNDSLVDMLCPISAAEIPGCYSYRCACESAPAHGAALTVIDMMKPESYEGWDFENTWRMDEGAYKLPVLQWETEARDGLLSPETALDSMVIAPIPERAYNGKAYEPTLQVSGDGVSLKQGIDYRVSYSNNVDAGTATATVEGWGAYIGQGQATYKIAKAANPIKVKVAKKKFKRSKKKKQTTKVTVTGAQGKVKFSSNKKKVKVSAKGKVTIAKGFKGKAKITVKAAGNSNYKAGSKAVTIQVK